MDGSHDNAYPEVQRLRRWEQFGGVWKVIARDGPKLTISLCRCDGGEEVDRLTATNPELVAFIGDRSSSDQAS